MLCRERTFIILNAECKFMGKLLLSIDEFKCWSINVQRFHSGIFFLKLSSRFVSWINFTVTFFITRDFPVTNSSVCRCVLRLNLGFDNRFLSQLLLHTAYYKNPPRKEYVSCFKSHLYRYIAILTDLPCGTGCHPWYIEANWEQKDLIFTF